MNSFKRNNKCITLYCIAKEDENGRLMLFQTVSGGHFYQNKKFAMRRYEETKDKGYSVYKISGKVEGLENE